MKFFTFIRSLIVLALIPVLTFVVSSLAIVLCLCFRVSSRTVQVLPRFWARIISRLAGVKVTVEGEDKLRAGQPYIFAVNHQSPVLGAATLPALHGNDDGTRPEAGWSRCSRGAERRLR